MAQVASETAAQAAFARAVAARFVDDSDGARICAECYSCGVDYQLMPGEAGGSIRVICRPCLRRAEQPPRRGKR